MQERYMGYAGRGISRCRTRINSANDVADAGGTAGFFQCGDNTVLTRSIRRTTIGSEDSTDIVDCLTLKHKQFYI